MAREAATFVLALVALSCGAERVLGGEAVAPEAAPALPSALALRPGACVDSAGEAREIAVSFERQGPTLIERRAGHDSLIVRARRGDRFVVVVGGTLHLVDLAPRSPTLVVAASYVDRSDDHGFWAEPSQVVATCRLAP